MAVSTLPPVAKTMPGLFCHSKHIQLCPHTIMLNSCHTSSRVGFSLQLFFSIFPDDDVFKWPRW